MKKISTTVSDETYEKIKKNRWKFSEMLEKGVHFSALDIEKNVKINEFIENYTRKIDNLSKKSFETEQTIYNLKTEIQSLKICLSKVENEIHTL
ncbi:MAG: hypothetical protein HGB12_12545 [Bacteroidetes bacterium]|nr:hypothetical protein [Bacteroidota bacterium]